MNTHIIMNAYSNIVEAIIFCKYLKKFKFITNLNL